MIGKSREQKWRRKKAKQGVTNEGLVAIHDLSRSARPQCFVDPPLGLTNGLHLCVTKALAIIITMDSVIHETRTYTQ